MRSKTPCQFRYAIWRLLLVLWTVLFVPALIKAGKSDHPLRWKNVWQALELLGLWLLYLFIFWKARRRALEEKKRCWPQATGRGHANNHFCGRRS